jgi:hypothetical protein
VDALTSASVRVAISRRSPIDRSGARSLGAQLEALKKLRLLGVANAGQQVLLAHFSNAAESIRSLQPGAVEGRISSMLVSLNSLTFPPSFRPSSDGGAGIATAGGRGGALGA